MGVNTSGVSGRHSSESQERESGARVWSSSLRKSRAWGLQSG